MEPLERAIRHPAYTDNFGPYSWCLQCERAGRTKDWIEQGGCPLCGADFLHQWRWEMVREANPGYPAEPQINEAYPLYGK